MSKFDKLFYKTLRKYQREDEYDVTSKLSPKVKEFLLRNNLKYNKRTNSFDTEGNVRVYEKDLIDGHLPVQIGEVGGHFEFVNCSHLTSLKNCPKKVGKNFSLYHCINLTSLAYGPEEVGYIYDASFTSIRNLEGGPKYVGQHFYCNFCYNLETLNGIGQVQRKVWCGHCPKLKVTDQDREQNYIVDNDEKEFKKMGV